MSPILIGAMIRRHRRSAAAEESQKEHSSDAGGDGAASPVKPKYTSTTATLEECGI